MTYGREQAHMEAPADLRDLRNMTDRDRAANAAALFLAAQEPGPGGREYQPPAVEVGGVLVAVYVRDGALVVTVDPAGADPEVFRLHGETAAVPMAVSIAEGRVFEICPGDDPPPGRHRKQGDEPYS